MKVVMFHSVGNHNASWHNRSLSVSVEHFDNFCQWIVQENMNTCFLNDWYKNSTNEDSLVVSFDDGFLDNWVIAFPILKKYKIKATFFINPEFVEKSSGVRQNLDDVNWNYELLENKSVGFLNWDEIKYLQKSGIVDIQSHSMSHNRYFYSKQIVDIYSGQSKYDWLLWTLETELKTNCDINENLKSKYYGYPIFQNNRALSVKRYFPNDTLIQKAKVLFVENRPISEIIENVSSLINDFPGKFETDEEMKNRFYYELYESKRIVENILNKPVQFLCWPGGEYNQLSLDLSSEVGYIASTVGNHPTLICIEKKYKRIDRIGLGSFYQKNKKLFYVKNKKHLVYLFKGKSGNVLFKLFNKLKKSIIVNT